MTDQPSDRTFGFRRTVPQPEKPKPPPPIEVHQLAGRRVVRTATPCLKRGDRKVVIDP